jgi:ABC-type bacteriocin/lantibiotic exporter with double-glycine peptidase domain
MLINKNSNIVFLICKNIVKKYPVLIIITIFITINSFVSIEILRRMLLLISKQEINSLIKLITFYILASLFSFILSIGIEYLFVSVVTKDMATKQKNLLDLIIKCEQLSLLKFSPDELTIIITQTLSNLVLKIHEITRNIINGIITIIISFYYMKSISNTMIFICIFPIIVIPIIQKVIYNKIEINTLKKEAISSKLYSFLKNVIENRNTVNILGLFSKFEKKLIFFTNNYKNILNTENIYKGVEKNFNFIIQVLGICLILSIGAFQVYNDKIKVPDLVAFIFSFEYFVTPVAIFTSLNISISEFRGLNNRLVEVTKFKKENESENKTYDFFNINSIEINDLEVKVGEKIVKYPNRILDFSSDRRIYFISGKNGAGKTLLLRLFMKYEIPIKGYIKINGINLNEIGLKYWRSLISYAPQSAIFHNKTIVDDIIYLNNEIYNKKRIEYFIDELEINELLIKRKINSDNDDLSDGEKQKINLLRAFYKESFILFLDEPYVSLDNKTKLLLDKLIEKEKNKRVIIIVSHEDSKELKRENEYKIDDNEVFNYA